MAFVYSVHGSEDGIIGMYGSKKRAIQAAHDYIANSWEDSGVLSVESICSGDITYVNGENCVATVEKFEVL